jgi:ATPase subunit of ABC transporter with duplicated ATPase domains
VKIVRLTAENVKRLVAVNIEPQPDGSLVIVSGRNGQGKTSVLDSIWLTLENKAAAKANVRPVRDGETTAYAELDLGDLVVRREWRGETSKLEVRSKAGARYPSPQKMLDELVGKLSFDPIAFLRADQKAQRAQLLQVVDVGFDPDEFERKRKAVYDERTEIGREVKRLSGARDKLPHPPAGVAGITPGERIDVTALANELVQMEQRRARASQLNDQVNELQAALVMAENALAEFGQVPGWQEVQALQQRLQEAEHHNRNAEQLSQRASIQRELDEATGKQAELTKKLEQAEVYKAQQIASAQMPVDGLSFNEDGLTYRGVPLGQASGAEQLRVAVGIAMAANPSIRVIRVADGSLLDRESLAALDELARERDFQIWIERVEDDSPMAVVIEDGQVKS